MQYDRQTHRPTRRGQTSVQENVIHDLIYPIPQFRIRRIREINAFKHLLGNPSKFLLRFHDKFVIFGLFLRAMFVKNSEDNFNIAIVSAVLDVSQDFSDVVFVKYLCQAGDGIATFCFVFGADAIGDSEEKFGGKDGYVGGVSAAGWGGGIGCGCGGCRGCGVGNGIVGGIVGQFADLSDGEKSHIEGWVFGENGGERFVDVLTEIGFM
mmetsp:Transcript_31100/g.65626  ORF Transcript_31100/g.65626 Transcript_31100/m.65626 type:complete len:209 (+) Transcript_31100:1452-2078(+)